MIEFKKSMLEVLFKHYERFYMLVHPHENLSIGKRGLVGDENKNGIVLVFGSYSYKEFSYLEDGISVLMRFSGHWESMFIPFDAIGTLFDNPSSPGFVFNFSNQPVEETTEQKETTKPEAKKEGNLIMLDFKKDDNEN